MGCNPDILENICPSDLQPSGLYFPIYPDYNPCIISLFPNKGLHGIFVKTTSFTYAVDAAFLLENPGQRSSKLQPFKKFCNM